MMVVGAVAVFPFALNRLRERRVDSWKKSVDQTGGARSVRGTLHIVAYGDGERVSNAPVHQSIYVNGPDYHGMEDNDVRGYLDGRFKYGWNQPTQVHVRIGRRDKRPRYGELELFRVLHRWAEVDLPDAAQVVNARLSVTVERGPDFPVEMYVYSVNKDWNPGAGGELGDNVSPPKPGEVWWGDIAYKQRPWGLPGAGFASEHHPDADTPLMPLASAWYRPDEDRLDFSSPELARYLQERTAANAPLLFLIKLSDDFEDSFGTVTTVYSGNHGDNRNVARRPHLHIEWTAPNATRYVRKDLFLEHGRSIDFDLAGLSPPVTLAADFRPTDGFERPTVDVRAAPDQPWRRLSLPITIDAPAAQLRVMASTDPIVLGDAFETTLRDTWILTAPPEEQYVRWAFQSPSGRQNRIRAEYRGEYTWSVRFTPDEIGRWRYEWTQDFAEGRFHSSDGVFDVVRGDDERVRAQLAELRDRILAADFAEEVDRVDAFGLAFARLERAAMRTQTPESYASKSGRRLRDLVGEVRAALAGKPPPDVIPFKPQSRTW